MLTHYSLTSIAVEILFHFAPRALSLSLYLLGYTHLTRWERVATDLTTFIFIFLEYFQVMFWFHCRCVGLECDWITGIAQLSTTETNNKAAAQQSIIDSRKHWSQTSNTTTAVIIITESYLLTKLSEWAKY